MSYGSGLRDGFRLVGVYTGRILKGRVRLLQSTGREGMATAKEFVEFWLENNSGQDDYGLGPDESTRICGRARS
jgi:hypothetical protein